VNLVAAFVLEWPTADQMARSFRAFYDESLG